MTTAAIIAVMCGVVWMVSGFLAFARMDAGPDWFVETCMILNRVAAVAGVVAIGVLLFLALGFNVSFGRG